MIGDTYGGDVPLGLGMALAQNANAMTYFASLSKEERRKIIDHTHSIKSRDEMQSYVSSLGKNGGTTG